MKWSKDLEALALSMKDGGSTYKAIAENLGTTPASVKHKVGRLRKGNNEDRYKHTSEKIAIAEKALCGKTDLSILETHCGFGGMTEYYSKKGSVLAIDIKQDRVDAVNKLNDNVSAIKADSEEKIFDLVVKKRKYDVVDLDPYGFPSRFFPHVFKLIDDGYMFITFPIKGAAQLNKITIRHYEAFWGILIRDLLKDKDGEKYVLNIKEKLLDYAFMNKRQIKFLCIEKIDRVYRIALKVEKKSMLDIVGLKVKGKN